MFMTHSLDDIRVARGETVGTFVHVLGITVEQYVRLLVLDDDVPDALRVHVAQRLDVPPYAVP